MSDKKKAETTESTSSEPVKYGRFEELVNLLPQAVIEIKFDGTVLFAN